MNFTIIGGGVSESPDQHVHIVDTPGFNIGAAGQPPKCRNNLHSHRTAEVVFVLKGRWRFFWGRWGTAGEVVAEDGNIFNIPTGNFRAFENVGSDYGMIMAVLGGDDAGRGVVWVPQVITDAKDYGLNLGQNAKLYDIKSGQALPEGVPAMPLLTGEKLTAFPEPTIVDVVSHCVARSQDLIALSDRQPAKVIGANGKLRDRPGFDVEFPSRSLIPNAPYRLDRHVVLSADARPLAPDLEWRHHGAELQRHCGSATRSGTFSRPRDDRRSLAVPGGGHRRQSRSDRTPAITAG